MRKILIAVGVLFTLLVTLTFVSLKKPPQKLNEIIISTQKSLVLDRNQNPLLTTYAGKWNEHQLIPLQEVPPLIQKAFIAAEDKRFYSHSGIDWIARFSAVMSNLKAMRVVRGASTITEQVARLIHPRPRTIWSRWLEGFEAMWLEQRFSKEEIFEFYLNQVPFAANRKGIVQASAYYFDRDLKTLNPVESLALASLLRSPSRLDLYKNKLKVIRPIKAIAKKLHLKLQSDDFDFDLQKPQMETKAPHFINYVNSKNNQSNARIISTLHSELQNQIQTLMDRRIQDLKRFNVHNGAVLVVDFTTGEILSWVNAGNQKDEIRSGHIDAILTPRQPGSTLKPFLYALALEQGWTAATIIEDEPFETPVGHGVHTFKNYSRRNYGALTLRQSLANSLNIPAIKTIKYVGINSFFGLMKRLGFSGLKHNVEYYGEGLVLGNAEVTLLELVQAYGALANKGVQKNLYVTNELAPILKGKRIFSPEVTSIIGNILSDNDARSLEFQRGGVLDFPYQTAIKTGTSTDFRDSWTLAYNDRYVVGAWMGNLDGMPTDGLTGSSGPAMLVRSIFALLNKHREVKPLYLSEKLISSKVCRQYELNSECAYHEEYFISGTEPKKLNETLTMKKKKEVFKIITPYNNLKMALDPRVPKELRSYKFQSTSFSDKAKIRWKLNGKVIKESKKSSHLWNLKAGNHDLEAELFLNNKLIGKDEVSFLVRD